MKRLWIFMGIVALFCLTLSVNAFAKSSENEAACKKWCKENQPRCVKCDSGMSCGGRDLDIIKSFKKGTGNWYACGLSDYARESLNNKNECLAWCRQNERCESCKDKVGCGSGLTSIKTFGGRGENWYACGLSDYKIGSAENEAECEQYCDNDPNCDYCARNTCDWGYTGDRIKTFGGRGQNWYACRYTTRSVLGMAREEECNKFCRSSAICDFCTIQRHQCGAGKEVVARFRGKGRTVFACKNR